MIAQMRLLKRFNVLNKLTFLKQDWKKGVVAFFITYFLFGLLNDNIQILRNTSQSLPYHVFLYFPKMKPERGDITVYKFNDQYIIKKISIL